MNLSTALNETFSRCNNTAGPQTETDSSDQFKRENLVGMFLTLQLCQLTQPYGSLLFHGVSGFFWRCNPIASLVEALIILWHLGVKAWKAARRRDPPAVIVARLQETASGLLLLRGALSKDGTVGGLLEKLISGSFLDAEMAEQQQQMEDADTSPSNVEASRPPRRTNSFPGFSPQTEKSRILREAFGSNVLAHRELRIDLFTGLTELFVLIKLLAVTGIGWFTAAGVFMFVGWTTVQALLVLLHLREMDELKMYAAVRTVQDLSRDLQKYSGHWQAFFIALHLPVFGYPAYLAAFRPWFPEDATGFVWFLKGVASFFSEVIALISARLSFWFGLVGVFWLPRQLPGGVAIPFLLFYVPVWVWWTAASLSYTFQNGPEGGSKYTPANFTSFFEPHTFMYHVVDQGFVYTGDTLWFLFFVLSMAFAYWLIFFSWDVSMDAKQYEALARKMVSAGNVIFTVVMFSVYLASYDAAGTFKPWWTELLG
ncbi:hypothetical protein QBC47DRAFT_416686 [Echria macrotheca]|uniref:Uncharacterized protein n=1 Tax=Echria macrotheca TaxID=438768 RepID=A0AAJ0B866_9PEZI|nr:hypothetical protein QBC47DRAFT_416686 [Echria macrotheca]